MSRACIKPDEEVCSIKKPVAKNPRKNRWIDHINKEAKRLKISYMSAVGDKRVKESYRKPLRLKKKKVSKGPTLDEELEQLEREKSRSELLALNQQELEQAEQQPFLSPPRSPIPTRLQKPKTDTTKKSLRAILELSPIKTPDFAKLRPLNEPKKVPKFRSATPPRKNPESIIRNPKTRIISRRIVEK
jgi:hypothetical protein